MSHTPLPPEKDTKKAEKRFLIFYFSMLLLLVALFIALIYFKLSRENSLFIFGDALLFATTIHLKWFLIIQNSSKNSMMSKPGSKHIKWAWKLEGTMTYFWMIGFLLLAISHFKT